MSEFKLPDVGEGLTEAEIVLWKVKVGDVIKVNDIIVDIETAKSIVELPSPYEGTIDALLVAEGETVAVGTPIIRILSADEAATPEAAAPAAAAPAVSAPTASDFSTPEFIGAPAAVGSAQAAEPSAPPEERQKVLVGYGPRASSLKRRARKGAVASVDTEKVSQRKPLRALAKPPVRKLAKDLGVDLGSVPSAGEIITRADVEAFAGLAETPAAPAARPSSVGDVRVPIKGVRKMTAAAMVSSAFTAPHVTEWVTVDVTRTMDLVKQLKKDPAFKDVRVSPLLIVAKAVLLAMKHTPEINSSWDEAAQEIVLKGSVNLGIAAATPRGLVVPNVVGADSMTMVELGQAFGELITTARDGKTQPAQMAGGSFTITNIGVFGIDAGTPILNPGEAGILAVGAINKRPWVGDNDEIVARWVTTLALSFDHRLVDGEQGSHFLADVAAILRDPAVALTY
ncbi:pyruvate dehydrogenase E2 component (dihydrolipoamide acetyltransferase) [Aeromicrobium panaciterrae]|uniref:Dihydrolipoamide acetyltransferase component of pyruvate dehydrogenase complex n=1 Tax=Aeromicrobium panaciterrae TaxID=363861 RepID=A0ABU1UKH1_9ACTN|nr:dihydrolipoamide acetyltransferase family protein [Aeromicrobium panaciterrae]MDR7085655.1 pyruvate dehydrogenase E2 component (dihydrolipoamide acetyltransferase) [Aeromicrobium panaciterrae]